MEISYLLVQFGFVPENQLMIPDARSPWCGSRRSLKMRANEPERCQIPLVKIFLTSSWQIERYFYIDYFILYGISVFRTLRSSPYTRKFPPPAAVYWYGELWVSMLLPTGTSEISAIIRSNNYAPFHDSPTMASVFWFVISNTIRYLFFLVLQVRFDIGNGTQFA